MRKTETTITRVKAGHYCAVSFAALMMSVAGPALAQQRQTPPEQAVEEIVVTGSLIRGVAPVGTNSSAVSTADIQRSGAISTNQILTQIPALTNAFNVLPVTPTSVGRSTFRPDLRNLGNNGHANTLVLIDGHNAVGSGILQTTPDIGMLPPGAIERVEVVADGGSSIYGSDAIGGIINFITRTRFDGFEVKGSRGFADHYDAYTISLTGGFNFERGSAILSFYTRQNSELLNIYRERPRQNLLPFGGSDFRVRNCAPGNIIVGTTTYALPSRTPGQNLCDTTSLGNLTPAETQNALYGALTYKVADKLDFEMKAFGSERRTRSYAAQRNTSAQITNANPFFQPIGNETAHTVTYSYAPVLGQRLQSRSTLTAWQVNPQLTWTMGGGWRSRLVADYGWSETSATIPLINTVAEAQALRGTGLTRATALNPYDLTQTNASVINNIANFADQAGARQKLRTIRGIADGPLFSLPGGQVRAAVGVQHQYNDISAYDHTAPVGQLIGGNNVFAKRTVNAVFGELIVPVVGEGNAFPGVQSLDLDFSARYDRYSDFGGTTNPKLGVNWTVFDSVKLRGNIGTSYVAPSLADTEGAVNSIIQVFQNFQNVRPGDSLNNRLRPYIQLNGGTPGLEAMPATTWSVGVDFAPVQFEGFRASLTYWDIDQKKRVGFAPLGTADLYNFPVFQPYYFLNPTLAQALQITRDAGGFLTGAPSIESIYGIGNDPYIITDSRRKNLGRLQVSGIDFSTSYRHPMDWGAVYGSVSGTYKLDQKEQAAVGVAFIDRLANNTVKLTTQGVLGADVGRFTATATVNYTGGFPLQGVVNQTKVKAFAVTNFFFRYDAGRDLMLTLNVDNVFDVNPPYANVSGGIPSNAGFQLGSTLGRYWNFGISKRF